MVNCQCVDLDRGDVKGAALSQIPATSLDTELQLITLLAQSLHIKNLTLCSCFSS